MPAAGPADIPLMRRSLLTLVAAGLLLASAPAVAWVPKISTLSPREAARQIQRAPGVRVVMIYSATCPHCRSMFPDFVDFAERCRRDGVTVLTFSTDDDPELLADFLGDERLPFPTARLVDDGPGELSAALEPTGIDLGARFGVPFLAVIDRDDTVVGQGSGSDLSGVEKWLDEIDD
jgi:thiol-disulfide isomerase/thioredoxin